MTLQQLKCLDLNKKCTEVPLVCFPVFTADGGAQDGRAAAAALQESGHAAGTRCSLLFNEGVEEILLEESSTVERRATGVRTASRRHALPDFLRRRLPSHSAAVWGQNHLQVDCHLCMRTGRCSTQMTGVLLTGSMLGERLCSVLVRGRGSCWIGRWDAATTAGSSPHCGAISCRYQQQLCMVFHILRMG